MFGAGVGEWELVLGEMVESRVGEGIGEGGNCECGRGGVTLGHGWG